MSPMLVHTEMVAHKNNTVFAWNRMFILFIIFDEKHKIMSDTALMEYVSILSVFFFL